MFDTTGKIAIAQLAFFLAAVLPAHYCLFKHRGHGFLGWLFLCLFCIIRITGAAIIVADESGNKAVSKAGLIISSVAVAPLILSVAGIAHESYYSLESYGRILFGWIPHLLAHVGCSGAIALIVVGYLKLEGVDSTAHDLKIGLDLARAGSIILLIIWVEITAIMMLSYTHPRALREEKQLAAGVSIALLALFIRILYTIFASFINTAAFNLRTGGTTAEKTVLNVLPEFILTMTLLAAGIISRNLQREKSAILNEKNSANRRSHSTAPVGQA